MKALELVVYPPIPPDPYESGRLMHYEPEVTAWENARYEEDVAKYRKRLTDAELAAEYWRAGWIAESERSRQSDQVARTLYRFATRPSYDEDQP